MLLRSITKKGEHTDSEGSGSRHDSRRGSRGTNIVHPVADVANSPLPRSSTVGCKSAQSASLPKINAGPISQNYIVKVRALHGIDLFIPCAKTTCQRPVLPTVNIAVNNSAVQSFTAAQHGRNHSIWKKHELKFRTSCNRQNPQPPASGSTRSVDAPHSFITMMVHLSCTACSCVQDKMPTPVGIGEVGELQLPVKESGEYEITRFFPVIRRQEHGSHFSNTLVSAGKVKLRIHFEVEKPAPASAVLQPEVPKRIPFALTTNFEEALQLKRKQLKATVVPEQATNSIKASQFDMEAAAEFMTEVHAETAPDKIDGGDLKVEGRVGEGIHSCVSLGILYRGNNDGSQRVAVKEFRHQHDIPPVSVLTAFLQEYRILTRCRSQNGLQYVVELIGVTIQPRLIILMEYLSRGSLAQCLLDEVLWGQVSIKQKLAIGLQVARGIAWLHKSNMIHRDIKSHNILLGDDIKTPVPTVKIGDLGSAIVHQENDSPLVEEVGSSGYTAPEIFTHQGYNSKIDVWSFGVVLWELASSTSQDRTNPFMGISGEEFVSKARIGCRPRLTHPHQHHVSVVIEKCWRFDPLQRPNMDEVVKELEKLSNEL